MKEKREQSFSPSKKEGLFIQYELKKKGLTFTDVAKDVDVTQVPVQLVVFGKRHSQKIENHIANLLGFAKWNDLVAFAGQNTQGVA